MRVVSELQAYYETCKANVWVREKPEECGCRGRGWFLSDVDTLHKCPVHSHGQPEPEL